MVFQHGSRRTHAMTTPPFLAARYSAGARVYGEHWAPVLLPHSLRLIADLPLAGATRIVDIGTGVGSLLPALHQAAPRAHIVGCDIAPGMLALAPRSFGLVVADAARLPFADAAFDAAVMAFAIFFVPDPARALAEMRRILRPGAALALTSWYGEPQFPALAAWIEETGAFGAPAVASWPAPCSRPIHCDGPSRTPDSRESRSSPTASTTSTTPAGSSSCA
jgi:SAM-dependent methyltransferase